MKQNISFNCKPHLFCCVDNVGEVAIPCYNSEYTKFYSLLENDLREVWFSKEADELRKKVKNCQKCLMHCIIEYSRVVGETHKYPKDLIEWVLNTIELGKRSTTLNH